jgi:hypothetical protein
MFLNGVSGANRPDWSVNDVDSTHSVKKHRHFLPQLKKTQASSETAKNTDSVSMLEHFRDYMKRIGFAIVGKDIPAKTPETVKATQVSLREEAEDAQGEPDPTIGRWPSSFQSAMVAPPPRRENEETNNSFSSTKQKKQLPNEFTQLMKDMSGQEETQKQAFDLVKNNASFGLPSDSETSEDTSLL